MAPVKKECAQDQHEDEQEKRTLKLLREP